MKWPFVLRSRYEAARAEADRQRERADKFEQRADTAVFNRRQIARQLVDADVANRRLAGRNLELGRRLSRLTESDPEYTAQIERRLERALRACARWMNAVWVETRHTDRLQARLDDALGLNDSAVLDGRYWQQTRNDGGRKGAEA
ncbi:hypothetical protein [Streptomyces bullii]|uniref:Uncharacterized protein n=1 Tax=Streptomyces bullii TaxID=349910 RepID=A0ABW0ULK9_9ACTN